MSVKPPLPLAAAKVILAAGMGSMLASLPPAPDAAGEWLSTCFWLLGGIYLIMQILRGMRGTSPEEKFASKGDLDRVEAGSRQRAATNAERIDSLHCDLERRHDENGVSTSAIRQKLDELTRTMTKSFEDIQRALGRLEGRNQE